MKGQVLILFFLFSATALAQEVPVNTEQQMENLSEENLDDDALLQQLSFFQKHPLNLNMAAAEELRLLRFLTDLQIHSLLSYRSVFGNLLHIYELQAVPGFDLLTIQKLLPFVSVGASQTVKEAFSSRIHGGSRFALFRVSRTLERSKGYDNSLRTYYLGDPNQLQARYAYQYKNLFYYGIVADKDAVDLFFNGAQKNGFDFYSVHFFVRNIGRVKALALGDYALNLGQGLIHWQSLAFGKSAEVMQIKRQAPVLLPYRSAGEFYFNRGAATTLQLGALQATAFVSFKSFTGNVVADSMERFTSFMTSGYHRTRLEVEDRNRLSHFSSGGAVTYDKNALKIGLNAVTHHFSLPLHRQDEPFNRFALRGKSHFLASVDYSYTYKNAHFFGELASDRRFYQGMVHGAMVSVDPKVDLSFLYRNIAKEFQSPFGNAFTESTLPANEKGFYTGIQIRPRTGWQLAAYADFYSFPFLKYRVSSPTRGSDYLVQVTCIPKKRTEIYLRYRTETKPLNGSGHIINYPLLQQKQSLRFHFVTLLNRKLTLKGRTELVWFQKEGAEKERGLLSYIETAYAPSFKLRGNIRLQYFETGSYNSRIYAYESDVLYSFSIPAFFDRGFRYYLNLHYSAGKNLNFWLRLAKTVYQDKDLIGSGLNQISGNQKTELKGQICYFF